ncbi:Protein phosphatase [Actinidia chinensis var. chinensis]|uniref:protein-serine/threonine phosphatase n=1 Tax=Actinidia chinensis var. chinensis TaxID=1590841 RepID=A0A2R6RSI4_ACTCC|nr:Protein phosphatase [Actinidia chinensis var. chinensis]
MALSGPQLQRFITNRIDSNFNHRITNKKSIVVKGRGSRCCSAIAIDAPSSMSAGVAGIRWGSTQLQGAREEMEDDVVIVPSDDPGGFSYAAVFDGHAGFSSVEFLREELYKECVMALQGGALLSGKDFNSIKKALQEAFEKADAKLLNWLDESGEEVESGSTATVMFTGNERIFIAHVGDSCVVLSRSGKTEVLTNPHRPYGSNRVSLQEIRRISKAGGWIVNGRICGDISVSRAFGDMRFKTKKNEMLEKGVKEGRWSQKFISRIQFSGDLVTATPDIFQIPLGPDAEFILLASDGLWDYMNSSDAVNFVSNQLRQHGDVQLACEALGRAALDRRSQDNVSIVIADLGRTDWQSLPVKQANFVYELGQAFATIGIVSLGIWMSSMFSL